MSRRTAYWLAETIELLLGIVVVVLMFLPVTLEPMLEPTFGDPMPDVAGVPVAAYLAIVPRLLAVVALVWMIRIYLRPEDEGGRALPSRSRAQGSRRSPMSPG